MGFAGILRRFRDLRKGLKLLERSLLPFFGGFECEVWLRGFKFIGLGV